MDDKTQDLLLQLLQDIAVIKSKLDTIEEIKIEAKSLNNRVDQLEAQNREHDKTIKSLENRASTMEQFTRNNMADAKKQQTGVFISMGLAIFSSIISIVIGLLIK
jgi:biopolymer transport protein ExbB/TolQ